MGTLPAQAGVRLKRVVKAKPEEARHRTGRANGRQSAARPGREDERSSAAALEPVEQRAVRAPLESEAPHPAPAPVQPGELELPYPPQMVRLAAETFAALADPSRAQIVAALLVRELSVGELAAAVGLTQSATSHHLRLLRDRRLVKHHRHGHLVYYSIDDVHVAAMFAEAFRHIYHVFNQVPDHPYALGAEPRPLSSSDE